MRIAALVLSTALPMLACAPKQAAPEVPSPAVSERPIQAPAPAASPASPELSRRIARLELTLLEKDAQVEDLQSRLNDTRQEVVRAMSKLQTLATRAEAASGMAEAEVALQSLRTGAGSVAAPEALQTTKLLQESSNEFTKLNYGGALYLANQAKTLAGAGRGRLAGGDRGVQRPGETPFALPIHLKAVGRGNVREGPGAKSRLAFAVESGAPLTGYSYMDEWIRIGDDEGHGGWISRALVARR